MTTWNKDYISLPSFKQYVAMSFSFDQWNISKSVTWQPQIFINGQSLCIFCFLFSVPFAFLQVGMLQNADAKEAILVPEVALGLEALQVVE